MIVNLKYHQSANNFEESIDTFNQLATSFEKMKFRTLMKTNHDGIMRWIQDIPNINDGDLVLFYYFGHCYWLEGENYLIPTDDKNIEKSADVEDNEKIVTRIIHRLRDRTPSGIVITILDCYKRYKFRKGVPPRNRK